MTKIQIFGLKGFQDFNEKKHLKNITKVLFLKKNENEEKILIAGGFPIMQHKDFENYFEELKCGNFSDYTIIGAADMSSGCITDFVSRGYDIRTDGDIAVEISKLLENPPLIGCAKYQYEKYFE